MRLSCLCALLFFVCCTNTSNKNNSSASSIESTKIPGGQNPFVSADQSPMDMSYFPKDFPILRMNGMSTDSLVARVIYSRPQVKGRPIFGEGNKFLVPYGKEWRAGANEATEIEFFKNVQVNGVGIDKGRYILYCIPSADSWKIILNSNLFTWGLHIDSSKDVFRVIEPVMRQSPPIEMLTIFFEPSVKGMDLNITWDSVRVKMPIEISK